MHRIKIKSLWSNSLEKGLSRMWADEDEPNPGGMSSMAYSTSVFTMVSAGSGLVHGDYPSLIGPHWENCPSDILDKMGCTCSRCQRPFDKDEEFICMECHETEKTERSGER